MSINDASNLTNLSQLINHYAVNKNLDLDAIEKDMIQGAKATKQNIISPNEAFESAMAELQRDVGITIDANSDVFQEPVRMRREIPDRTPARRERRTIQEEVPEYSPAEEPIDEYVMEPQEEVPDFISSIKNEYESAGPAIPNDNLYNVSGEASGRTVSPQRRAPLRPRAPQQSQFQPQQQQYQPQYQPQPDNQYANNHYDPNRYDPNYYGAQESQDAYGNQQMHLNNVITNYSGGQLDELSLKREQEEDTKSILLEDIDEIKFELEDDGVDISRVPEVDQDSPLSDVQKVHKMLKVKYIRRRYNDFGHEIILAGAQGLGYVFDGQRQIGPFKPNFNGWHNEVRTKLRRMRYETATIVSDIVQEYNIGPVSRLLFELVPSAIVYSHMKKDQHGQSNYSVDQVSHAINELRDTV